MDNTISVSLVNFWEIAIKNSVGKLKLTQPTQAMLAMCKQQDFQILSIKDTHIFEVEILPFHHRDPFDRLLIAQAKIEGLTLVSKDGYVSEYNIKSLW